GLTRGAVNAKRWCPVPDAAKIAIRRQGQAWGRRSFTVFRLMSFAAVCVLALSAADAAPAAAPAKLIPLKVAYDGYSMTTAPMNYAVEKGIFKKYGLDVTLAYVDGGSTLSQAVVGGSINIAQNGYAPAATAAVQGADVVFIG